MVQLFASITGSFPKGTSPVTLSGAQIDKITWLYDKSTEVRAAINALLARITGGSVRLIEPKISGQENERLMTAQLKNLARQITVQFILYGMCVVLVPDDKSFPRVRSLGDFIIERAYDGASWPMYKLQLKINPKEAAHARLMLLVREEALTNGDLGSSFASLVPDFQRLRVMKLAHYYGFIRRQTAPMGFLQKGPEDVIGQPILPAGQASDANADELNAEAKVRARVREGPRRINFHVRLPMSGSKEDDKVERDLLEAMVNHEGYVPEVIISSAETPATVPIPPPAPELAEMRQYFSSQASMVFGLPSQLWDPSRMSEAVSESVTDATAFHVMTLAQDVREALELLIRNYSLQELLAAEQEEASDSDSDSGSMGDDEQAEPEKRGTMEILSEERRGAIPMDQSDSSSSSSSSNEEEEEERPLKRKLPKVTVELIPQLPLSMALQLRETKELNDEGFRRIMQSQLGLDPASLTSETEKVENKVKLDGVDLQKKKLKLDEVKTKGQLEQGEEKLKIEKDKNKKEEEGEGLPPPAKSSDTSKKKDKDKKKKKKNGK
jgi:hypothetical protein